jgi:hypothetical protein
VSLLSAVTDFLKPAAPPDPQLARALAHVAGLADPVLRTASHFDSRLAAPLQYALGYCDGLVAALPGPIDIDRQAFTRDPLVHALFATAGDIEQMLGRSQAVRDFLANPACWEADHFYAMLVARRQQKKQLGMARHGDLIENDVPQLVLYFSDQTLIEPCCDLEKTRERLRCRALDSLLQTFQEHLDALRNEREGLRADVSVERAHLTVLRGSTPGREYEVHTRHLAELDARLRTIAESLMPDPLLEALGDFLSSPEPALRLSPFSITVDGLGVVREKVDDSNVHTLYFPELSTRDKRLHLAMLARISRDEALEAVETVRDQQHRFMLI